MEILREYGLGPRLQQLIQRYWYGHRVVPKSMMHDGRPFNTGRRVTQGDQVSPKLFNIIVDALVKDTLK